MFVVLCQWAGRTYDDWKMSGPFMTREMAEQAVVSVLGQPGCLAARILCGIQVDQQANNRENSPSLTKCLGAAAALLQPVIS